MHKLFSTKRFIIFTAVLFSAILPLDALPVKLLKQNFETNNFSGQPTGTSADGSSWKIHPLSHQIVDADGSQALQISRNPDLQGAEFHLSQPANGQVDFSIKFKLILHAAGRVYLHIRDKEDKILGGVLLRSRNNPAAYSTTMMWMDLSKTRLEPGIWQVQIDYDAAEGNYQMTLTGKDGNVINCAPAPILDNGDPAYLYFGNAPPKGINAVIDDLEFSCARYRSVKNRTDFAQDAKITRKDRQLTLLLDAKQSFSILRVKGECDNPFTVQAVNSAGHLVDLGEVPAEPQAEFRQLDFQPETGQQVRITFQKPLKTVPEVALYEAVSINRNQADALFKTKVYGEFTLPVYQDKTGCAALTLINTTSSDLPVKVSLTERYTKKAYGPVRNFTLKPGENTVEFELANLPHGNFVAHITDNSPGCGKVPGTFRRLLRREILPEPQSFAGKDFTGNLLIFPDDFHFTSYENIKFVPAVAQLHQVTQPYVIPGNSHQHARNIGVTPDGKLEITITTTNNRFHKDSLRKLRATASLDDLDNWDVKVDNAFKPAPNPNPILDNTMALDNRPKPGPDGKIRYRFYNAERDGKINIRQIAYIYIHFQDSNQVAHNATYNFEGYIPQKRTTWPIWYKAPGEALVLTKEPLFSGFRSGGEFELESDANDNFGDLWLSEDGKYLCFAMVNTMRRYPPYDIAYDNLTGAVRIIRVMRTCDGINYERYSMAIPFADDNPGVQHYSIHSGRLKNNGGLMTGTVYLYDAYLQRIYLELTYSYDGYTWKRFHGAKPFVDNGPHGTLTAGYVAAGLRKAVEIGDTVYATTEYVSDAYHVLSELMWDREDSNCLTESILKKHLIPRAEKWPLLKLFRDFKEVTDYTNKLSFTVAMLTWRKDGLFSVQSESGKTGCFTTIPVKGKKALAANLKVLPGGFAEFELLDKNGSVLPGYQKTVSETDSTSCPIFSQLPDGEFQVRVKLKNATLYALCF